MTKFTRGLLGVPILWPFSIFNLQTASILRAHSLDIYTRYSSTLVYTAVIFRFFSDFLIFRLFADRSAYTSTALIFRVFRIFLFSGYLPAATHTCIYIYTRYSSTLVYTAVIFRFFSDFLIFRLFADRSAYTSTALIFRVFRIFLFSGYLPAATHTCIYIYTRYSSTLVYTAVIFRFFSDFLIFRLFADRSAYTSTALIFRVFRIFLFSGYLPAATHTCISPPATARLVSHIVNQLLLAIITAAKLILVLWLRRYSESCRVPLKLILCTVSLGAS